MNWQELWCQPDGVLFVEVGAEGENEMIWIKVGSLSEHELGAHTDHVTRDILIRPLFSLIDTGNRRLGWREMPAIVLQQKRYHVLTSDQLERVRDAMLPAQVLARLST